ncbi:MAG: epoxide hydrolase family protein, partial [Acidimicrobiales bacterium]
MADDVSPFLIEIGDEQLADLAIRLANTRWPEPEVVEDWSQGVPLAYLRPLVGHWAEHYDWRTTEARLNAIAQFKTEIDGVGVHFLHVPSPEPDALPLVLTHGWPGSIVEFLEVIGPLSDPAAHGGDRADAFHVVCPSLPGYGFSDKPPVPGWGVERIASAWAVLMARLGYGRYGAQGGDWGSAVTAALATADPEHVAGIHVNMVVALPSAEDMGDLTDREKDALAAMEHYQRWDSGYSTQQSSRPQTVGYALVD